MPQLIEVTNPREFPAKIICFACRNADEARKWAERKGAKQVWYYQHKFSKMVTAAIKRDDAK